jgi:hypothetical protein
MPLKDPLLRRAYDQRRKDTPHTREWAREYSRKLRQRPGYKQYQADKWLKHTYGITRAEYERMFAAQDGCCAICRQPGKVNKGRLRALHVDHDHVTGQVRGLLCHQCNVSLHVIERPEWLTAAHQYLQRVTESAGVGQTKTQVCMPF